MAHFEKTVLIGAPPSMVFEYVQEPSNSAEWFPNLVARWKPREEPPMGVGTLVRCVWSILGHRIEAQERIIEYVSDRVVAYENLTGYESAIKWQFEGREDGTDVTVCWDYASPPAPGARFGDSVLVERIMAGYLDQGLENLQALVEQLAQSVQPRSTPSRSSASKI